MDASKVALPIVHLDAEGMGIKDAEAKLAELRRSLAETGPPNQFEFQAVVFIRGRIATSALLRRRHAGALPAPSRACPSWPTTGSAASSRYGTVLRSGK